MSEGRSRRSVRHQKPQFMHNIVEVAAPCFDNSPSQTFLKAPDVYNAGDFMLLPDFTPDNSQDNVADNISLETSVTGPDARGIWQVIFYFNLIVLLAMTVFVFKLYQPHTVFEQKKARLFQDIIFDGISVDGQDVGGLSLPEALKKLENENGQQNNKFQLNIEVDGVMYIADEEQLSYGRNTEDILRAAYAIGRQGFPWMIGSDKTPFDIRYEHTLHIKKNGAQFKTETVFSQEAVRRLTEQLALQVNSPAQNSQLVSFDFDTQSFSVTKDVQGVKLNVETALDGLTKALQSPDNNKTVFLYTEKIFPQFTAVELQNSLTLLSSFSTQTGRDELRNRNIALATRAIHGKAVMPGEEFSFNQVVGQRTAERGYQLAPAIAGGILFDDVGGGICQVSTTLFNAAAMAQMSLVTRKPHAWPVSYVEKGLDATVNWPNIDFVFKNETKSPVFIAADYKNDQLRVEIYGMRQDKAESIRLETVLVSQTRAPSAPLYKENLSLLPGEQREVKKARDGYLVDTYRLFLRDGQVYQREKLFSSDYRMMQQVIEYH